MVLMLLLKSNALPKALPRHAAAGVAGLLLLGLLGRAVLPPAAAVDGESCGPEERPLAGEPKLPLSVVRREEPPEPRMYIAAGLTRKELPPQPRPWIDTGLVRRELPPSEPRVRPAARTVGEPRARPLAKASNRTWTPSGLVRREQRAAPLAPKASGLVRREPRAAPTASVPGLVRREQPRPPPAATASPGLIRREHGPAVPLAADLKLLFATIALLAFAWQLRMYVVTALSAAGAPFGQFMDKKGFSKAVA